MNLPDYIGPCAFGIKLGVILPGCDLPKIILDALKKADHDGLLSDGDSICITESVVARAQNNFVTIAEVGEEIRKKLSLLPGQKIGVLFPITSRNRFAMVLEGIARAVPQGEVLIQLSYPADEVGNQLIPPDIAEEMMNKKGDYITPEDLGQDYAHPLTGVNYIQLYTDIVAGAGARPNIYLSNNPLNILKHDPHAVIVADIHTREKTRSRLAPHIDNCITLQEIFNDHSREVWSEWGLLGSNMSSGNKIKLAPREADSIALDLQGRVLAEIGKKIEVIIYGDGAYKDPSSGIYELADPLPAFGATPGVNNLRKGVKYKYLVDIYHEEGKSEKEILEILEKELGKERTLDSIETEGTTPRRMQDVLASLADLVSGSADAGTPLVIVKGICDSIS